MIGREIGNLNTDEYSLLFYADIMSDGKKATHQKLPAELIHKNNMPAFLLKGCLYEIGNQERYQQFWAIYDRPPEQKYRDYLLERRDCLIPVDERDFKGAFYTPLHIVDKAYELLAKTLGKKLAEKLYCLGYVLRRRKSGNKTFKSQKFVYEHAGTKRR